MKDFLNILLIVLVFLVLIPILHSCKKQEVPIITTSNVTNITATSATCGGNITDEGSSTVVARGVCWSTGITPTDLDSKTTDGAGAGSFISNLTDLNRGTIYFVRAYATNNAGTGYGNEISFPTNPFELATLTTSTTVSLTENIAISGGNITSDGGSPITARGVCWSTTPYPTITGPHTIDGNGTGASPVIYDVYLMQQSIMYVLMQRILLVLRMETSKTL